jgi:hypothetical protein
MYPLPKKVGRTVKICAGRNFEIPRAVSDAQMEERYTRIAAFGEDHVISTASPLILLALTEATDLRSDYMNGAEYVPSI